MDKVLAPEFTFYNQKVARNKRLHKFNFKKEMLMKKYNFPPTMTAIKMAEQLGYDVIWDCGLFRYVYYNEKAED